MEASFAAEVNIMHDIEKLLRIMWFRLLDVKLPKRFPRLTYHEAMARYGSDKPDMRLGMEV